MKLKCKPCVPSDVKKRIRQYCKDYHTEDLTIVVTDDWTFKPSNYERGRKNKYAISCLKGLNSNTVGVFHSGRGSVNDIYGFRCVDRPAISIKWPQKDWFSIFLHEFGHYQDWKHSQQKNIDWRSYSGKRKERYANEYAEIAAKNEVKEC